MIESDAKNLARRLEFVLMLITCVGFAAFAGACAYASLQMSFSPLCH